MLAALSIRNIVLIDRLDLEFGSGFNVMTGETGAGKSILLDALALALGARGDAGLVGHGASHGRVTAGFEPRADHPVFALLSRNGLASSDQLLLRRVQMADGPTRAFVNDQPVSVQLLKQVGAMLVEIHGQHDDRALTDPAAHRALLDAFGGLTGAEQAVAQAYQAWRAAEQALAGHETQLAGARANADYLRHALEELKALDPQADEEDALAARRQIMMQSERIAGDLSEALDALAGDGTAPARLAAALRRLERQPPEARALTQPVTAALERVLTETEEARGALEGALRAAAFEPGELEAAEARLFELRALARKHKAAVADLPGLILEFEAELDTLDAGEDKLAVLRHGARQAGQVYRDAARDLSQQRRAAAARLDKAVTAELAPLRLDGAEFMTRIECLDPDDGGPHGVDRVAFWVRTNPGTEPGPLMKVASGGELARFMLALKVVLAARGSAPTLIFDEIDASVGGATAAAIGERLARLAEDMQVLAVTHAPQVAAQARGHYQISKQPADGAGRATVATRVAVLDASARREEIARMLAGQTVTDEARAAAQRLIGGLP